MEAINNIAIMELISILYIILAIFSQIYERSKTKTNFKLRVCLILTLVYLTIDALSYIMNTAGYNQMLVYIITMISYAMSSILIYSYDDYCASYLNEKIGLSTKYFVIPKLLLAGNAIFIVIWYLTGHLEIISPDGIGTTTVGDVPLLSMIIYIAAVLYPSILAMFNVKKLGIAQSSVFAIICVPVIGSIFINIFANTDLSVVLSSFAITFAGTSLQSEKLFTAYKTEQEQQNRLEAVLAEFRKANEQLTRERKYIEFFVDSFSFAYFLNLSDKSYEIIRLAAPFTNELKEAFDTDNMKFIAEHIHPDDRAMVQRYLNPDLIRNKLKDEKTFSFTIREILNGKSYTFSVIIMKVTDENHVAVCYHDITEEAEERKEEEKKRLLAERQNQIAEFSSMVNAAIWNMIIDDDGNITQVVWSDKMREMLGFESERDFPNVFDAWALRIHPDDRDNVLDYLYDNIKKNDITNLNFDISFRIAKKNWDYRWHHAYARVKYDNDGLRRIYGIITDITDEKRLNQQLMLSDGLAREYHTVFLIDNESAHHLTLYRSTGEKTLIHALEFANRTPTYGAVVINYINNYVHPDDRLSMMKAVDILNVMKNTEGGKVYINTYRRIIDDLGNFDYHQACFSKAVSEDGTVNYILAFRDSDKLVREQIEQKAMLQNALEQAEAASKSKTNFLFNMSHDIRTPMNAIMGFTNIAKKHIDDKDSVSDALNKTQQAGELLLSLINDILDMSRIESGKMNIIESPVDFKMSFSNIESTMKELAAAKDIGISFNIGKFTDRYIYADVTRTNRIFINIITNAIKYTQNGGRVIVSYEQIDCKDGVGYYRYTFADNGIGMSEEFQKHVFEEFSREETATVSGIQGTGLGLAVVKSFVDLLKGTVTVSSKQGIGTTFIVTLPFKIDTERAERGDETPVASSESKQYDFKGKKVILAEDNALNREIALDILTEEGIDVDTAADGTEVVKLLIANGPETYDFILMDIQMPLMNGYEATKTIRETYPNSNIPIIALSANAFEEDKVASISAGMNDHVAKPINIEALRSTIAKYV